MHEDVCKLEMRMHASYELPMFNLHYMKLDLIQGCICNSICRVQFLPCFVAYVYDRYCRECNLCQRFGQSSERARMPHQPVLPLEPFQKWGLDFIGPFTPATARMGSRYILVATDYCTKWVETKVLRDNMASSTTKFLYENF